MMRGKKYLLMKEKISSGKFYPLGEAIALSKETSYAKFDGSIELHVRLLGRKPEDRQLRTRVLLPHGIGKAQQVTVLDEKTIEEIAESGKATADVYLATPDMMPKVAKIAKILGPKGKMPNPKSGTVTDKIEDRLKEITAGNALEVKTDVNGIIHVAIGKVSWDAAKLAANAETILRVVPRTKIDSVAVSATMGPGIGVAL